jgi:hypothetical protein
MRIKGLVGWVINILEIFKKTKEGISQGVVP